MAGRLQPRNWNLFLLPSQVLRRFLRYGREKISSPSKSHPKPNIPFPEQRDQVLLGIARCLPSPLRNHVTPFGERFCGGW